jgi:CTP synthase
MRCVGKDETGQRMEIIELSPKDHPYFIGVQYHPEFKSRPLKPSPVFHGLIAAAINDLGAACRSLNETPRQSLSHSRDLSLA